MNDDSLTGWIDDPIKAKRYLKEVCKLDETKNYAFYFTDGTGYCGRIENFIPYLIRRFKWNPNDSFEIEEMDGPTNEGELPPPREEGEVWDPKSKDPRF